METIHPKLKESVSPPGKNEKTKQNKNWTEAVKEKKAEIDWEREKARTENKRGGRTYWKIGKMEKMTTATSKD